MHVHSLVVPGAEGRVEDYIYLEMIENEWRRPLGPPSRFSPGNSRDSPSSRASIVLLYWAYFETRIDRLFREAFRDLAVGIAENMLMRYSSIGSRLNDLYHHAFGTTYFDDLKQLGFDEVQRHIHNVHERRNRFAHGIPQAINDELVDSVVKFLKDEHESWIAVFNKRATKPKALLRN